MSNTENTLPIKEWAKKHITENAGKNVRQYTYQVWNTPTGENVFGGTTAFAKTEGTVVCQDEDYALLKISPSKFRVIAQDMLSTPLQTGSKVALTPFHFKDLSGLASDGHEDPVEGYIRSFALTGAKTNLPATWPDRNTTRNTTVVSKWTTIQNPYLRDLIGQMESIKDQHGRNAVDVLVWAGGKNVRFVDPSEEESCHPDRTQWPSIEIDIESQRFKGSLAIRYDRAMDTYSIDTVPDSGAVELRNDICFDELLPRLADIVDDGEWKKIAVLVIKPAPKPKKTA